MSQSLECPTCQGTGIHVEHHEYGLVEHLGCQDCQGTGRFTPAIEETPDGR